MLLSHINTITFSSASFKTCASRFWPGSLSGNNLKKKQCPACNDNKSLRMYCDKLDKKHYSH
jgi:hypothetical protein